MTRAEKRPGSLEPAFATGNPAEFCAAVASVPDERRDDHPLTGAFGRSFFPVAFASRWEGQSFALTADDGQCVLVECDVMDGVLGRFGSPLKIISTCTEAGTERSLFQRALRTLSQIALETSATKVVIADPASREVLSGLGLACLAAGGAMSARIHAVADLSHSVEELRADVRKSTKSLLNWGRRSLQLRYCNAADFDRATCEAYRQLHSDVAGPGARDQDFWDAMFDTVCHGPGELTVSYLDGELVGGLIVQDGGRYCYYVSAAYVPERRDVSLAHWPVMDAMLRAQQRGLRWFDVGEVLFPGTATEKEESIGHFKKGFTSRIEIRPEWRLPRDRERDGTPAPEQA
jgi:hypothetical protein